MLLCSNLLPPHSTALTFTIRQAYFWEVYSLGNGAKDSLANDAVYDDRVIKHLRGVNVNDPSPAADHSPYIPPSGPGIDASFFNIDEDETMLFIMIPVKEGQPLNFKIIEYLTRVISIETTIRRHIQRRFKIIRVQYVPLEYDNPEDLAIVNESRRGMCLFQYDPNSDGNGRKAWRIFMEDDFYLKNL